LHGMQEVDGSIPSGSTNKISELRGDIYYSAYSCPHRLEAQDIALSRR
jgi:hypothetical protein